MSDSFLAPGDADTDFNGDGITNSLDLDIMKDVFFERPGPSALANACD